MFSFYVNLRWRCSFFIGGLSYILNAWATSGSPKESAKHLPCLRLAICFKGKNCGCSNESARYCWWKKSWPPGMCKALYINNGIFIISTGAGFFPSTVSQSPGRKTPAINKCIQISLLALTIETAVNSSGILRFKKGGGDNRRVYQGMSLAKNIPPGPKKSNLKLQNYLRKNCRSSLSHSKYPLFAHYAEKKHLNVEECYVNVGNRNHA